MNRPPLEVADLIRVAGQRFIERSRSWLTAQHRKVLAAIERCRTAALDEPATLGGGRSHPRGGAEIHRTQPLLADRPAPQGSGGHRALSHRRARRASR